MKAYFKYLLIAFYCMIIFISLELFLAIFTNVQPGIISYDNTLIWKYSKNRVYPLNQDVKIRTNSEGFRDTNHDIIAAKGITRIAIIGDSYTFGGAFNEEDIFTNHLDTILNKDSTKYEIFNFGVSAYGTDQEYLVLREIAKNYNIDIVVIVFSPNDIRESYTKRLFILEDEKLKKDEGNKAFNLNPFDRFLWDLSTKSRLVMLIQKKLGLNYGDFTRHIFTDVVEGMFFKEDFGHGVDKVMFLKEETPEMMKATLLFRSLILEMKKECKDIDSDMVIVNLPIKIQFNEELDSTLFDKLKFSKILHNITSEANISYFDMTHIFSNSPNPLSYYISEEFHLSKEGHVFVGEQLAKYIKENYQDRLMP